MSESVAMVLAANTVVLSSPLILAALGGYCSERGGVVNIALEGKMLTAACAAAIGTAAFHNAYAGLALGVAFAVLVSLVHWAVTQLLRVDAVVSGMAINVVAYGGTTFLSDKFLDPGRTGELPLLPMSAFYVAAFGLPLALWAHARWTRAGLRLMAVGSDPEKARLMGVAPLWVRFWGLVGAGVFCGLGGAAIVSNVSGRFTQDMTAGRGFIALAALILGGWRPIPAALACIGFGFCSALQIILQGSSLAGAQISPHAWSSLPYLATILALAGLAVKNRAPAGSGKL